MLSFIVGVGYLALVIVIVIGVVGAAMWADAALEDWLNQ